MAVHLFLEGSTVPLPAAVSCLPACLVAHFELSPLPSFLAWHGSASIPGGEQSTTTCSDYSLCTGSSCVLPPFVPRMAWQCIYSWRGAEYHYLQRLLDEDFDDVTTLQLRSNYRSSQSILQAANRVIQGGPRDRRVGGGTLELKPTKVRRGRGHRPPGHPVFFSFFPSCASEAATIAEEIESLVDPAELSPWARGGRGGGKSGGAGSGGRGWAGGKARGGPTARARAGEGGGARGGALGGEREGGLGGEGAGASRGYTWRAFCVLYRTHAQAVQLQQGLADLAIPCIVVGGSTLFQRKVVKDLIAYMRLVANPADSVALGRIYNTPSRGLGAKSWATVQQWAQGLDSPVGTAILELALGKHADNPPAISKRARESLLSFAHLILTFRSAVGTVDDANSSLGASSLNDSGLDNSSPSLTDSRLIGSKGGAEALPHAGGLLGSIVDVLELKQEYSPAAAAAAAAKSRSPNPAALRQRHEEEGKRALDQMERLQDLANRFGPTCGVGMEGVRNFLEQIALLSGEIHESEGKEAQQLSANAVRLMTIHKAKGLEFPVVFLTGLENRILPLAPKNYKEMAQWKGSEERPGWERVTIGKGSRHHNHHHQNQQHKGRQHNQQQQQQWKRDGRVQSGDLEHGRKEEKEFFFNEEERRLCYVAMTRAQDRLYLSGAQQRRLYAEKMHSQEPSVFLDGLQDLAPFPGSI
ncbi:unnamed protein product [Closterium sp. NIES-54]